MSDIFERIAQAVYDGDVEKTQELADEVIASGIDPNEAINKGGVVGLDRLGKAFDELEVFLPELIVGGEAMTALIEKLTPHFKSAEGTSRGTVVIGCAKGDLHDIGKNLVATQLSINGFKVYDLGTDVAVNAYIDKAKEVNADIIAVSSLLTTSAYYQEELVNRLKLEGLRDKYKVVVGGGPITPDWTRKIGADGYARTANLAVELCKEILEKDTSAEPLILE
ncbi:MAG: corrinoid protein [Zhaonellaceae bacterium]|jgi:dimethylamine corrinoid protein